MALRRIAFLLLLLCAPLAGARLPALGLGIDRIENAAFAARGLRIDIEGGQAVIALAELTLGDLHLRDLRLHCPDFQLDERALACRGGSLRRGKRPPLPFRLDYRFADGRLVLGIQDADAASWSTLFKHLRRWHLKGRFDLDLALDGDHLAFGLAVRDLGFNNDDQSIAGEGIAAALSLTARRDRDQWTWQTACVWSGGEAFWSPWYRRAGVRCEAQGAMTAQSVRVDQARLSFDGLGAVTAGATWDRAAAAISRWGFVTDPLDLSVVVREWVRPVLEAHALPAISASGRTRYAAEWSGGALQSFYAGIESATFADDDGRLRLESVNASVPWSRDGRSVAEISVAGGQLDAFPLGGFRVPIELDGAAATVPRVAIPFLDGRIRIDDLHARREPAGWVGRFAGGIDGVSLPRLTTALGLPVMAGRLSMQVPAANYADHVLEFGGDMKLDIFDGAVTVRHLRLIDPLSPTSRFTADVAARGLDLGLITSTFSFGSILGRVDLDIDGLELRDWQPLAFRARIDSSPGDYRRAISRGALVDISALGGAAGAAAVSALPAAGIFDTFGYRRIGFGCTLGNGVCRLEGLRPEDGGQVLVDGGGMLGVKVMGYNRSIDWNLLVSRLKAVIAGKSKAIIQ